MSRPRAGGDSSASCADDSCRAFRLLSCWALAVEDVDDERDALVAVAVADDSLACYLDFGWTSCVHC